MEYNHVGGARLNTILTKKVFKHKIIHTDEVKAKTGLSIQELIFCWLLDPGNNFQKAVSEWTETGEPMNFDEIQGY